MKHWMDDDLRKQIKYNGIILFSLLERMWEKKLESGEMNKLAIYLLPIVDDQLVLATARFTLLLR